MKKFLTVLVISLSFCAFCAGSSLKSVLPVASDADVLALSKGGTVTASSVDGDDVRELVPFGSMMYSTVCSTQSDENSFTVLSSRFIPYPSSWDGASYEEKLLKVYNILLSVSTQKGLKYVSGNKEKTLFEDSYCISDSSDLKSKVSDPVVTSVPMINQVFACQKDNRFGSNAYQIDYVNVNNEIFMNITNLSKLSFMGYTCLDANKLSMTVDAYLTDDGILLSAMAFVKDRKPVINVLFYKVDLASSFARRIDALGTWFASSLH